MDSMTQAAVAATVINTPEPTSGLQTFAIFLTFFLPALALVVVVIRGAGRWSAQQFGWDDGLICTAMAMSIAETAASYKCKSPPLSSEDVP